MNGYWVGTYELELQTAVSCHLCAGHTFFDVGANAGFFSLLGASKVGPTGKCVAFEPLPENAQNIREQLALNHFDWCAVAEAAVGDTVGKAQFVAQRPGSPTACFAADGQIGISVVTTTLDEAFERFGPPHLIKIDIEGAELRALQGARKLLASCRPRWIIEVHGPEHEEGVRLTLNTYGYAVTDLHANSSKSPTAYPRHLFAS